MTSIANNYNVTRIPTTLQPFITKSIGDFPKDMNNYEIQGKTM